jgi:hypothetical protein
MQNACAVLYSRLWPIWLYHIFPRYLINGTFSKEKVNEYETCVLISSTAYVWNVSHSKKNSARYKCTQVFTWGTCYCFWILMKLGYSGRMLEKCWNTKVHENPCSGRRVGPCWFTRRLRSGWIDKTRLLTLFKILRTILKLEDLKSKFFKLILFQLSAYILSTS